MIDERSRPDWWFETHFCERGPAVARRHLCFMGGSPAAPQPQNPQQTAQAQTTSNVQTAIANAALGNTNQVTPQGTLTYSQTGGQQVGDNFVPSYTATQTLSPEQQAIYDKTTGLQSGALDTAGQLLPKVNTAINTPLDFSKLAALPTDQTAAKDQAYGALTARSNQDLDRQTEQQKVQLANQGIQPGSEAYNNAMLPLERARVDASNQATINSGTIAGQNIDQAQTIRNQGINEQQTLRNQPLQDYQSLVGLGGGVQQPTYAPPSAGNVAPTDVAGITAASQAAQMQQYQIQQSQQNALMGGIFGLGGSALGAAGTIGGAAFL